MPGPSWSSEETKQYFFDQFDKRPHILDDILGIPSQTPKKKKKKRQKKRPVKEVDITGSITKALLQAILPFRRSPEAPAAPNDDADDLESPERVHRFINETVERVSRKVDSLDGGPINITLRHCMVKRYWNVDINMPERRVVVRDMVFSWPGKDEKKARHFTQVYKLIAEIQYCLRTGTYVTLRDLYYRDPELYHDQGRVNFLVDAIALSCNASRKDLRVGASTKGLVAGLEFTWKLNPDAMKKIDGYDDVPYIASRPGWGDLNCLNWILVIEKEATFKSLVTKRFHHNCVLGPGLMITARGYPDLATRCFLHDIIVQWRKLPSCADKPVYGLFDCDTHGFNIFKIYQQGSRTFAHDNMYRAIDLQFLGVKMSDILPDLQADEAFLRLTAKDRKLAQFIINDAIDGDPLFKRFNDVVLQELQLMLKVGMKAEIQLLEDRPGGLEGWLNEKMKTEIYHPSEGCPECGGTCPENQEELAKLAANSGSTPLATNSDSTTLATNSGSTTVTKQCTGGLDEGVPIGGEGSLFEKRS